MSEIKAISTSDLRLLQNGLVSIGDELEYLNRRFDSFDYQVDQLGEKMKIVYGSLDKLNRDFQSFVSLQIKANRLGQAETRVVKIRQEIEKKYGHYDFVRRTTIGILQANDIGIVKKETMSNVTEELMLMTPDYWLTPCLIALSAWINDDKELSQRALIEAMKRDDEKSSLFFALVCRRADRTSAGLKWIQRYLMMQDEEKLDRKSIIIIDSYASGLLGIDSEKYFAKQIDKWMSKLLQKPEFVEKQKRQWSSAILGKIEPLSKKDKDYHYLKTYSPTWQKMEELLQEVNLHEIIFHYFKSIFDKDVQNEHLKKKLDQILYNLVTDFDSEELDLRKSERLEQLVIKFDGDENRALSKIKSEMSSFEETKDFTQLLTDAAMNPEITNSGISMQKFAIALTKEWIIDSYHDIIAQNRAKIPVEIEINIGSFVDKTKNGDDEVELESRYKNLIETEKQMALDNLIMTGFEKFSLFAGIIIAIIGVFQFYDNKAWTVIGVVIGLFFISFHHSAKTTLKTKEREINKCFEERYQNEIQILRALLAEVVDFRRQYREKDKNGQKVLDFLNNLTPEQYIMKVEHSSRKINTR